MKRIFLLVFFMIGLGLQALPELNYSYEKRFIDADGNFEIWYVSAGCTKKVAKDKPGYLSYVAAGYEVKELPYVAPAEIPIEELRLQAVNKSIEARNTQLAAGYLYNGKVFDTSALSRELLTHASQIADKKADTYTREIVLADGTVATLTRAKVKELYSLIQASGEVIYDNWLSVYKKILTADREALKVYITNGNI